jgi:hypothetical protein
VWSDVPLGLQFELISMSSVMALKRLRDVLASQAELDPISAAEVARRATADGAAHDYASGLLLHTSLDPSIDFADFPRSLRHILALSIQRDPPSWLPVVVGGRNSVESVLASDPNLYQLFVAAELFGPLPSDAVIEWWDRLANAQRAGETIRNLESGRLAERKTLDAERTRLTSEGCPFEPEWIALDDNSAGYDILSYVNRESQWFSRAIEVKSSTSDAIRFFLTRNEFDTASRMADRYELHFWGRSSLSATVIDSATVMSHAPEDRGRGRWQEVLINLGSLTANPSATLESALPAKSHDR